MAYMRDGTQHHILRRGHKMHIDAWKLTDGVERYLSYEGFRFSEKKDGQHHFAITAEHAGSLTAKMEVFHLKQDNRTLVIDNPVPLKDDQNA